MALIERETYHSPAYVAQYLDVCQRTVYNWLRAGELAGIKNVLAKHLGSKTPLNNARAAMVALSLLRTHKETAKERGISLEQIYS